MMQVAFHGLLGQAEFMGDLLAAVSGVAAQLEDLSHFFGQLADFFFDECGEFFVAQQVVGFLGIWVLAQIIVKGIEVPGGGFCFGVLVDDAVAYGAVQVGAEVGLGI